MLLPFEAMTPLWFLPGQGCFWSLATLAMDSMDCLLGMLRIAQIISHQKASKILGVEYSSKHTKLWTSQLQSFVTPHGGLAQVSLEILPPSSSLQRVFPGLPCLPDDLQGVLFVCMLILYTYIYIIYIQYHSIIQYLIYFTLNFPPTVEWTKTTAVVATVCAKLEDKQNLWEWI